VSDERIERRLAAILAVDVAGYSRLMGSDEEGTLASLRAIRREVGDPKILEHRGRIVKTTGDGLLVEFASVVDAVRCAVEVQREMLARNVYVPAGRRLEFRMGINVGDIIIEDGDIFGDGVNIAARLEALAEPGGICISAAAHEQVRDRLDFAFADLGEQQVKNIARPVRVYSIGSRSSGTPVVEVQAISATPTPQPLALPEKPSIAVLPFTNMSGDPEQEYFSDGITEDLITALSRLRWFFVIARNSSFVYKSQATDVKQVGRDLGVRYVLEGSVRKGGNRVRITGQLIDAITGNHIWAERYDRDLTDIFALQDEITASVTAAIEPKLLAAEALRTEGRSGENLNAWDSVARALSQFWKLTASDSDAAIAILRSAVERYPNYAPAHSLLAFSLLVSTHVGWAPSTGNRELAADLGQRAVQLDESDPWAYMALGYLAFVDRQTDEAIRRFRTAIDLNPNFAAAYGYVGWALTFDGRSDEAIENLQQALRMSPRDPLNGFFLAGLSAAHYLAGRYSDAVDWARQAVQLRPGILGGHRILCASLAQAGLSDEAHAAMSRLRQLHPDISVAWIKQSARIRPHQWLISSMAFVRRGLRAKRENTALGMKRSPRRRDRAPALGSVSRRSPTPGTAVEVRRERVHRGHVNWIASLDLKPALFVYRWRRRLLVPS
jgi:adenylate cyclase